MEAGAKDEENAGQRGAIGNPRASALGLGRFVRYLGWIRSHSSSVSRGLAIVLSSLTRIRYRPNPRSINRYC